MKSIKQLLLLGLIFALSLPGHADTVGNTQFVHLEKDNGVWWLVDHRGNRFITTGMNHVDERNILVNEINEGWMTGEFGNDIIGSWGGLNARSSGIGGFADMVVDDFKSYGFNTIPFHAYSVPLPLYEEREIYYIAKIKVESISMRHMNRANGARFPDVFSSEFEQKLDALTKKVCAPLRDAKYLLGYTFFDLPDLKAPGQWHARQFPDGGLVYPWVQDMRNLPASAEGKKAWIRILQENHGSAAAAARVYGIDGASSWDELAQVTEWPAKPNNEAKVLKDADDMLAALADRWYGLHRELIHKYDPNHLILGDKHEVGFNKLVHKIPDGVLEAIGKHCDIFLIQYYSFYNELHNSTLRELHRKTGLPIINGDHAFSHQTDKHTKLKGLEVHSHEAVGEEYTNYMKRAMEEHPYMLGWWYCGYIEQWAPAGTRLGQQCGFFDPFGEPNEEVLAVVKAANENAVKWHSASSNEPE